MKLFTSIDDISVFFFKQTESFLNGFIIFV